MNFNYTRDSEVIKLADAKKLMNDCVDESFNKGFHLGVISSIICATVFFIIFFAVGYVIIDKKTYDSLPTKEDVRKLKEAILK